MDAPPQSLSAALAWAGRGVPVLPIQPAGKAPLTWRGLHDASTDLEVLRAWWGRWPDANVAIATGSLGVDVLDVDVREAGNGWQALRRLRDAELVPEDAPVVRTPSAGIHVHFIGTDQRNGCLHEGHIDFRSTGGYVLVPPSYVNTDMYAGSYRWERRGAPTSWLDWQAVTDLLRPAPRQVVGRLRRSPSSGWDVRTLAEAVERTPVGNRNNMLFWAFCEALRSGYDDLRPIVEAGKRCGQTVREVEATRRQAVKRVTADGQTGPSATAMSHRVVRRKPAVERVL